MHALPIIGSNKRPAKFVRTNERVTKGFVYITPFTNKV
jgi:hypothetical protein